MNDVAPDRFAAPASASAVMAGPLHRRPFAAFAAILRAKYRIAVHSIAAVRHESRLKVAVVSIAGAALWFGVLFGFLRGFIWLREFAPEANPNVLSVGDILMARLLALFALALFFLLIFSNVLIAFSTFYKAREVQFLLQAPISIRTFFLSRFVECVAFSSWASAFLGSPLIIAYGLTTDAPFGYYLAALAFYVPFVTIPAALGAMITLVITRVFPKLPRLVLVALSAWAAAAFFLYLRRSFSAERLSDDSFVNLVLQTTARMQSPWFPSYWAAQGILSAVDQRYGESMFLLLLLVSNALFVTWVAMESAQRLFLPGFSAVLGSDNNRARPLGRGVLGRLDRWLGFLKDPFGSLVVKDIRLFWRDPVQWSQFVIFFGIMAVYVANLGNRFIEAQSEGYRSWIAGLNTASCSLILASLTSRFVYPLISLEGFRFWILGLAPLTLRQLMWQKFWLSVATTSPFTIGLIVLSCYILDVGPVRFAVSVYSIALANFALAGLAVGLGSTYPNFQEDNPARIVSGMGGTLNFLLSVGYITLVVGTQMVILQWNALERYARPETFWWALSAALIFVTVLSAAAVVVPMTLGRRNLLRAEF